MSQRTSQLLIECLCAAHKRAENSGLAQLAESDWHSVIASAAKHGLCPLLYTRLAAVASAVNIPETVLAPLRQTSLLNGLRNQLLYKDLAQALLALRQHRVQVIVLKGAHLGQLVYESMASRQMADIDLLVEESSLPKAAATLIVLGYSCEIQANGVQAWRETHAGAHHLPSFTKAAHPRIEVHWTLPYSPDSGTIAECWQRARLAALSGVEAQVLSHEDLIVQLCLHCKLHRFSQGIRPVWDISAVIRRYEKELDWEGLLACARAWRAERCVHLGLWLAKKLMQAPVPEGVLGCLQPEEFEARWASLAEAIVLAGEDVRPAERYATSLAEACATWRSAASVSQKARTLLRWMFPARGQMARYMAQNHALSRRPIHTCTSYATRMLDLLRLSVRIARQGQWRNFGQRLRWDRWLNERSA